MSNVQKPEYLNRAFWGSILLFAAVFALVGAWVLDLFGVHQQSGVGPMPFVASLIFLNLGLFTFWPVISQKGKATADGVNKYFRDKLIVFPADPAEDVKEQMAWARENYAKKSPSKLRLWDDQDPRLDLALFHTNIPTLVLNHEQKILDWNPAFELVFGDENTVARGAPIANWFDVLDNFKRVSQRAEKLYGEGILPLADRERATYISAKYGRMVFTRVMTPVIERSSGRTIGWNIVLNINSVNKRQNFFTDLYRLIAKDTRAIRYASSFDGIYKKYKPYRKLTQAHLSAVEGKRHILDIGCGTGLMTRALLRTGHKVTAIDSDVNRLRVLRGRSEGYEHKLRIVRADLDELRKLPEARFHAACLNMSLLRVDFPEELISRLGAALKPDGILTLSSLLPSSDIPSLYAHIHADLESQGEIEALKHQWENLVDLDKRMLQKHAYRIRSREDLRALLIQSGFEILDEQMNHLNGHTIFLKARKRSL